MGRERFGPEGEGIQDIRAVHMTDDLAVTVALERATVMVDGGESGEMVLRATHVYRREDGEWRPVHRRADFPPVDQRAA